MGSNREEERTEEEKTLVVEYSSPYQLIQEKSTQAHLSRSLKAAMNILGRTLVGILVQMLNSASVERGRATDDTVDLITLLDQKLGKVGTVLAGNTWRERKTKEKRALVHRVDLTSPG